MKNLQTLFLPFIIFFGIILSVEAREIESIVSFPNSEEGLESYLPEWSVYSHPELACATDENICIHNPKNKEVFIYKNKTGDLVDSFTYPLEEDMTPYSLRKIQENEYIVWGQRDMNIYQVFDDYYESLRQGKKFERYTSLEDVWDTYEKNIGLYHIKKIENEVMVEKIELLPEKLDMGFLLGLEIKWIDSITPYVIIGNKEYLIFEDGEFTEKVGKDEMQKSFNEDNENNLYLLEYGARGRGFLPSQYENKTYNYAMKKARGYKSCGRIELTPQGSFSTLGIVHENVLYTLELNENRTEWGAYKYNLDDYIDHPAYFCFGDQEEIKDLYLSDEVTAAYVAGWITGSPDPENEGEFLLKPQEKVNRAEFSKMLMLAFKKGEGSGENLSDFPDIEAEAWYIPYLSKAVETKTMKGYGDGTMKPGNNISVAEGTKMVLEVLGVGIVPVAEGEEWYKNYISVGKEMFPTLKFLGYFADHKLTRGECIELISKALLVFGEQ